MSDLSQIKVNGTIYQMKDASARTTLEDKADKATTLAGYGITDAYTKSEDDAKFLPLTGGTITGNILPNATGTLNLGASNLKFKSIYADEVHIAQNTLYVGDTPVLGTDTQTIVVKADPDQSLLVKTTGEGHTQIVSVNSVEMKATGQAGKVNINASGANSDISLTATNAISIEGNTVAIKGTTTIENLNVTGTTTTVNSTDLDVKDNIITLNKGQTGEGVSAGKAGIQIDRGDAAKFQIVFDESDDLLKAGMEGTALEALATRNYADNLVTNMATQATTLAGYGITDAYTKEEVNGALGNKVDTSTYNTKMSELDGSISGLGTSKQDVIDDLATIRSNASTGAGLKAKVDSIDESAQVNVIETIKVNDAVLTVADKTVTIDISGKQDVISDLDDIRTNASIGAALSEKVTGVATGAQVNVIETIKVNNEALAITDKAVNIDISGKQDVIDDLETIRSNASTGAGLATKVGGVSEGAQVNVIETVKVNNEALTVTEKAVNIDISGKQDVIDDLETIRSGAALGATSIQSHQDITGKADVATTIAGYGITDAKIEEGVITLGANTITPLVEHQDITGKANLTGATFTGDVTAPKFITSTGLEIY